MQTPKKYKIIKATYHQKPAYVYALSNPNEKIFTNRILLVRRHCPHCNKAIKVVNKINSKLYPNKQIQIVDGFLWDEFRISTEPTMDALIDKGFDSYPFFMLDATLIKPTPIPELLERFLLVRLREDLEVN